MRHLDDRNRRRRTRPARRRRGGLAARVGRGRRGRRPLVGRRVLNYRDHVVVSDRRHRDWLFVVDKQDRLDGGVRAAVDVAVVGVDDGRGVERGGGDPQQHGVMAVG